MTEEVRADLVHADKVEKVCHDLKQNIATGLLLSDPAAVERLDAGAQQRLELLHQQWEDAAALVAILNEEVTMYAHQVDLAEVARTCVDATRASRDVLFDVALGDHVVTGDLVLMRRAVGNLLDNAARAAGPAGTVMVRVGSEGPESWVEVADDGPGFGQITWGTGLGLEIVRAAVWASGGWMRIDTGPRAGTSVRMTFPGALRVVQ